MADHPGIGRYVRELVPELVARSKGMSFRFLVSSGSRALSAPASTESKILRSKVYGVGEQFEVPLASRGSRLMHVPHFNAPLVRFRPLVVTIHDLIYLRERAALRSPLKRAAAWALIGATVDRARAILTVSEATKADLLDAFPHVRPERISVVHEAPSASFRQEPDAARVAAARLKHRIKQPFILFVGSLKPHKNVATLVRAVQAIRERGLPHELRLVGRDDRSDTALAALLPQSPFVRQMGELPDGELSTLYRLADAVVLPSFREGFGLPVVEAMVSGTPAILARRSSLPEVGGDAAAYFDPDRVDDLAQILYTILNDNELRKQMSARGIVRAATFSWARAADQTLEVYRKVLSGRS